MRPGQKNHQTQKGEDRTLRVKPFVDKQGGGGLVNVLRTSGLSAKPTLRTERQTLSKGTIWCTENRVCVGTSGSLR